MQKWEPLIGLRIQEHKNFGCAETYKTWKILVRNEFLKALEGQVMKGLDPKVKKLDFIPVQWGIAEKP